MPEFIQMIEQGIGLKVILWFQSWRTDLISNLFLPFDWMGTETFFILLLTFIYWVINKKAGRRFIVFFLFSAWFNSFFKEIFKRPRPFQVSKNVIPAFDATEYGLPSGHTQAGTLIGLVSIIEIRKQLATIMFVGYIFLMGISRMVHGVHYPQDVILGWIFGILIVFALYKLDRRLTGFFREIRFKGILILTIITTAIIWVMNYWVHPSPDGFVGTLTPGGSLVGVIPGIYIESRYIRFSTEGRSLQKIVRYIVGIITLILIQEGLKSVMAAMSGHTFQVDAMVRFIRYVLVGLWLTAGAPWLFTKIKLASVEKKE